MMQSRSSPVHHSIGVIVSTYNNPEWLEKTLWGYSKQSHDKFELIVADDGSGEATKRLIDRMRASRFPHLKHVWHPDNGFQKTVILNRSLAVAESDYLIFTDQDCVPRWDFVEIHMRNAAPNRFLSGGYLRLPMDLSKHLSEEHICSGQAFELAWLRSKGLPVSIKNMKLFDSQFFSRALNALTPTRASWNGCNASGWRNDLLAANGFDERMKYGGEDRELGERLENAGIAGRQVRFSAICLHLDHSRPYKNKLDYDTNRAIRVETRIAKRIRTEHGLKDPYSPSL